LADRLGQLVADREPDPRLTAVRGELVRLTADIRPDENLPVKVLGGQLRQREPEHREVILSRVRAGVSRPQDRRQSLPSLIQSAAERMEPVPVLVVPGRQLLLRMRAQQRRVNVQRDRLRPRAGVPRTARGQQPAPHGSGRAAAHRPP